MLPFRRDCLAAVLGVWIVAAACGRGNDATAPNAGRRASSADRVNILLITIDTFRADRLAPAIAPALAELGRRGVVFTHARSVVPLTLPAHVSLMTGALPPAHGVRENGVHRFDGRIPTVADVLSKHGYDTAAFVGAYVLDRRFGLNVGFATYDDRIPRDPEATDRLQAERRGDRVMDAAIAWLKDKLQRAERPTPGPFFLWVHLYDPHAPYVPPPEYLRKAGGRGYDGEIAFADAQVARLLAAVDEAGLRDRSAIIVVGDHGESLGEHGEQTHGMLIYDGALRVPLIVSAPNLAANIRRDPISLIDIAPAMLQFAGTAVPPTMTGASAIGPPNAERSLYAESEYPRVAGWSPLAAILDERWKMIQSSDAELYDLKHDAGEARNEAGPREAIARAMAIRLAALRKAGTAPAAAAPGADGAERLRALGYVASSPTAAPTGGNTPNPAREIETWVRFERALDLLNSGQPARAVPVLKPLTDTHGNAQIFQSTYAQALEAAGRPLAALAVYRRIVARWPRDASLYHELAVAARASGQRTEAERAERAALALDPSLPAAHNGLGLLLIDGGKTAEAMASFADAVRLDPTNAGYWANLGNARRSAGDLPGAEAAYRDALRCDGTHGDAVNGLGAVLVQRGRAAEAVPLFEQLVTNSPGFVEARLNLGIAYQESGQRDRAAQTYREVLARARAGSPEHRAASDLLRSLVR